jgi:prepilin-type processing-associated H-X9-DG protein
MYKIIGADQKEYGPVLADQINQWIAQGRVNSQTKTQSGGDWKPLSEFPEFTAAFANRVPPVAASSPNLPPLPLQPTRTSGMAIASLVSGILGLFTCGVGAIIGLILGIIAMNRVKKSNGTLDGFGLALAGTIVSGALILMIPIQAAIFLPALAKAKQRALTIRCVNNMKQLALAARMYSQDNGDHFPPAKTWCDSVRQYAGSGTIFQCPAANPADRCDYAFNSRLDGVNEKSIAPNTVLFFETEDGWNTSGGPELMLPQSRHGRTYVVAFADGSVQQLTADQLARLRWNP